MKFIGGLPTTVATNRFAGRVVDGLGRVDLLDDALAQHGDAVGHAHRLDLVVRDIDERPAEVALEPLQLRAHLEAEQRVERGERLVEQERARVADERAPERDPLALAARQLRRLALEQVLDVELGRCLARLALEISAFGIFACLSGNARLL